MPDLVPVVTTVFAALSDPTRRAILETLSREGGSTATRLAADLEISRQAVAKHLIVLGDAGLTRTRKVGRESRVTAHLDPLLQVTDWIDDVSGAWKVRLDLLTASIENRNPEA